MIAVLETAAGQAAQACDAVQTVEIVLTADGVAVTGRVELALVGYTFLQSVSWTALDQQPSLLIEAVGAVAERLRQRRQSFETVRIAPPGEKPAVRLIAPHEWPFVAMTVLVLGVCLPVFLGVLP